MLSFTRFHHSNLYQMYLVISSRQKLYDVLCVFADVEMGCGQNSCIGTLTRRISIFYRELNGKMMEELAKAVYCFYTRICTDYFKWIFKNKNCVLTIVWKAWGQCWVCSPAGKNLFRVQWCECLVLITDVKAFL